MFLLYNNRRWNRLNLIKKSNILYLAICSVSTSLFISVHPPSSQCEIETPSNGVSKHVKQINEMLKFCLLERIPFICSALVRGAVFNLSLHGNGGYCWDCSITHMQICEDHESEKLLGAQKDREWFTERYREAHQQRKGLQMINNDGREWQEHIVFCSYSGVVIGFILPHYIKPVFLCLVLDASYCKLGCWSWTQPSVFVRPYNVFVQAVIATHI